MNTAANDPTDSPTTLDVFALARRLQHAYAERCGVASKYAYTKALICADISTVKLAAALVAGGFEMYSDSLGNLVIRTKESGDAHRMLVQAEKDLDYIARNPSGAPYAKLPSLR